MIHAAVIGTGNIAPSHIEGLLAFPDRCRIVALVDIYPEKAQAMKEKYHLEQARVFSSHEELLASGLTVDLVHVCTPPSSHAPIAIDCMEAGCNVLVEKPMAPSLKECDAMLEAERRSRMLPENGAQENGAQENGAQEGVRSRGVVMGCIAQNRFRNSIYKLKKVADSGLAGRIRCAHVDSLWWRGHSYYDLWWRGTWEKEGGGPTLNHAVHHIDMINWIQGGLPTEVTAMLANVMHDNSETEDLSFAALRYADGSVAEVTSSVVHHGEEQGIVLQCEKARLSAPWSCVAEVSQANGFPVPGHNRELMEELEREYEKQPDLPYEGHTGEIDNMLGALERGEKPFITGEDGRRTVELITAIYKAGIQKRTVTLPIREDDAYYTSEGIMREAPHFYEKTASVENFAPEQISVGNYDEKKEKAGR